MPFGLHPIWAVALLVIVLVIFGVGRLPRVGEALGRGIRALRRSVNNDEPAKPGADTNSSKD